MSPLGDERADRDSWFLNARHGSRAFLVLLKKFHEEAVNRISPEK